MPSPIFDGWQFYYDLQFDTSVFNIDNVFSPQKYITRGIAYVRIDKKLNMPLLLSVHVCHVGNMSIGNIPSYSKDKGIISFDMSLNYKNVSTNLR